MSPSRAPAISRTANARVYPALIHCSVEAPPPRSRRTDGPAIVAMVESIASMMLAVMTTTSTSQRRGNGREPEGLGSGDEGVMVVVLMGPPGPGSVASLATNRPASYYSEPHGTEN
jgi:hypothetical protein